MEGCGAFYKLYVTTPPSLERSDGGNQHDL
jgi:hypothetical protein